MQKYCESIYRTIRRPTREVAIGPIKIGGHEPIRIQSMTTTNTRDSQATIEQIIRLADAGCEIARVTVQGKIEAMSCEQIKNGLLSRGYTIPLVADIHFYPPAALLVAEFADKVRINPGNFVRGDIAQIEDAFIPLVQKCKTLKKALRIGANHGSLSERIMNQYGDSPRGMVHSCIEYAEICRKEHFHDIVFSMKASNPTVMIEAYRLLSAEMMRLGWDYPLHLGVTEAGEGEDGRIKSAMGIGALLLDGLGDTIRISLTEDPVHEIDPCRRLIAFINERALRGIEPFEETHRSLPRSIQNPLHPEGAVVIHISPQDIPNAFPQRRPDAIWFDPPSPSSKLHGIRVIHSSDSECLLFQPTQSPIHETRRLIESLKIKGSQLPVILCLKYNCSPEDLIIRAAAEAGAVLCDHLVEGICLMGDYPVPLKNDLSFNILQSARYRMTRTEYISCPGCGRTLFDLPTVARRIREKTNHLPGVKIAVMGCVVNGPGEMADADFGFVGSKPGKVDLYVGKTCVEHDIDMYEADQKLLELIELKNSMKAR